MGEKKRRLAARAAGYGPHFRELIERGFRARASGDTRGAEAAFSELLLSRPEDPEALHAGGLLGLQLGRYEDAQKLLARSIEKKPGEAPSHCNLALAYRHLGQPALAIEQLHQALQIDPRYAEAHANLGNLLLDSGRIEAAAASFERALTIRPQYADARNGLGAAQLALGRFEQACENLERAVAIDPSFHQAFSNLASARFAWAADLEPSSPSEAAPAAGRNAELALEAVSSAVRLCPEHPPYWAQFADCARHFDFGYPIGDPARQLLLRALDHPAVNPAYLARPIASLVASHPGVIELRRRLEAAQEFEGTDWQSAKPLAADFFGEPLLLRLLEDVVYPNALLERILGFARRSTLREILERPEDPPTLSLPAIVAMAHQCFNTEYVYDESGEEIEGVERLIEMLRQARESGTRAPLHWYAIIASYRPLHSLHEADRIAAELEATQVRTLAVRQIREPLEERLLRAEIPPLTQAQGEVSRAVQEQYESNPYPRWVRIPENFAPGPVRSVLGGIFPLADLEGVAQTPSRILVAGCGTGRHPIDTARRFQGSSVLAIDLSLASLAYALRKTRELGLTGIEYRQADILGLESIPERFDVIECSGVLHHLEDPAAGWEILCRLLRPAGVMRIGLYSELARRHVVRAREFISAQGFHATPEGIRKCRAAILSRREDELLAKVARGEDFYSMSGCRDLLFHVQERRFTLPQIAELLERLNLRFLGFESLDAGSLAHYRSQFPDDPALFNLEHWHSFETANPSTFHRMYQFWCRSG